MHSMHYVLNHEGSADVPFGGLLGVFCHLQIRILGPILVTSFWCSFSVLTMNGVHSRKMSLRLLLAASMTHFNCDSKL